MPYIHSVRLSFNSIFLLFTMCDCDNIRTMDLQTPRNVYLSAFYKRSFAFHTVKERMPVIITQTIDGLVRSKEAIGKQYGEEGQEDLKMVIGDLSKLKYEIQTNKPLEHLTSDAPDVQFYNNYIASQSTQDQNVTFFSTIWLLSECYMYRRVRQAFELTKRLKDYDPFRKQKEDTYAQVESIIVLLSQHLKNILSNPEDATKGDFLNLLKLNLWGNKCDLSLSNGVTSNSSSDYLFNFTALGPNILCDHSEKIWEAISDSSSKSQIVDIVFDNAGYELFTDLCLADYIITKKLAQKVRFYVKTIPWFISDVMTRDFQKMLNELKSNSNEILRELGVKWSSYVKNQTWAVVDNHFWTLPVDYSLMSKIDPSLYKQLGEAKLIIFKGDLNYRKLFGEKNWDPVTKIEEALQGFHPSKLCTLRTIKADIVCGLKKGLAEKMDAKDSKWMVTGNYGLIQFCDDIKAIE